MALDTGGVTSLYRTGEYDPSSDTGRHEAPTLQDGHDLGAALKAIRLFHGVTLQDLADATRIRQTYLAALEDMRLDELPSRPFAIGYVKAYARHLGLDVEQAVERFRSDHPEHDEGLRAPIGVRKERDPRLALVVIAVVLIGAAFLLWNVAQRAIAQKAPSHAVVAETQIPVIPSTDTGGPIQVGGAIPPPVESTTPDAYVTPGMSTNGDGSDTAAKLAEAPVLSMPLGAAFKPEGQIYGAPSGSPVIIKARRNGVFEVKGPDGSNYFTRVLQQGEAYRVPALKGLTVTVKFSPLGSTAPAIRSGGRAMTGIPDDPRFISLRCPLKK
ncbi:MAG: helix-turn-helix domain-containing protein [Caulobacteraceae bacterium]|nr:MAG: helix-turn-helix domain-containing protein [Caulobacteraceae bacterium]